MMEANNASKLTMYLCGGLGLNVAKELSKFLSQEKGFADSNIVCIDTSRSNLDFKDDDCVDLYLLHGLDGGGKIRKDNINAITSTALDILQKHKPSCYNIIINSAGGASGSTIGPVLAKHLLDKDKMVVVITVGSTASHIEATNTLNTLKSYDGITKVTKKPLAMVYLENKTGQSRSEINKRIVYAVNDLKVLFSGQNAELDSRDLYNWLRFERSTSIEPRLTVLTIGSDEELSKVNLGVVHSVAILTSSDVDPDFNGRYTEYSCNGFVPQSIAKVLDNKNPLFFVLSDGPIADIQENLRTVIEEMNEKRDSRISSSSFINKDDDDMRDDGIVL